MDDFGREQVESTCVTHVPCPKCGSNDNLAIYDDGHGFCLVLAVVTNKVKY